MAHNLESESLCERDYEWNRYMNDSSKSVPLHERNYEPNDILATEAS